MNRLTYIQESIDKSAIDRKEYQQKMEVKVDDICKKFEQQEFNIREFYKANPNIVEPAKSR